MALRLNRISGRVPWLLAPGLVFIFVFASLSVIDSDSAPPSSGDAGALVGSSRAGGLSGATTDQRVAALQAQARANPSADGYALLALEYLQKVRETGDPSFYSKASGALDEAAARDAESFLAVSAQGSLALSRHDFEGALALGERARELDPAVARNYGVIADAEIELGRYAAAGRTLQQWINLEPDISSYARVSYFRELNGDLPGALAAMELALSAGGESPENFSYVSTLIGTLHLDQGDYAAAERSYRSVLARDPEYPGALAGLARLEAGRGEFGLATARLHGVVTSAPLPEHVIALGETQEAAGKLGAAQASYELARVEYQLQRLGGVDTDVDAALFEANHGEPARAVALARDAWDSAPSVRSADALAWALSAAGRDSEAVRFSAEAMKLGSRDPFFLYRAGTIALRAGEMARARQLLGGLLEQTPRFSPLYAPRARLALEKAS